MFLIKEKPHNVVEKPTHRAGNKMWENWMEKEMEIFPNFILEKKQKSTIFEFIINPKNGQPILEHDTMDLGKTYKMASCNRTGEPLHVLCRMPNGKNVEIKDYTLHDAVEEYLKVKGTVNPVLDGRSIAVDLGTNAFSQMAETGYKFR